MSERNMQHVETTLQPAPPFPPVPSGEWKQSVIARLEEAAEAGNPDDFVTALRDLEDEDLSAAEFVHLIKLALEAGAYSAARQLSSRGASLHPSDAELQKCARVLAPPITFPGRPASPESVKEMQQNRSWMKANGASYRGKWVVLRHGELLGVGDSLAEAKKDLPDMRDVFVAIAY